MESLTNSYSHRYCASIESYDYETDPDHKLTIERSQRFLNSRPRLTDFGFKAVKFPTVFNRLADMGCIVLACNMSIVCSCPFFRTVVMDALGSEIEKIGKHHHCNIEQIIRHWVCPVAKGAGLEFHHFEFDLTDDSNVIAFFIKFGLD
jgi:hypothetical protein